MYSGCIFRCLCSYGASRYQIRESVESMLRNCTYELNFLCLIIMTFREKVVSIFNMATETERRFVDSLLIEIIV